MRSGLWVVIGVCSSAAASPDTAACHFVASLFAHAASRCDGGVCVNISKSDGMIVSQEYGSAVPVTCEFASALMEEATTAGPLARPREGDSLIASLGRDVLPILRSVLYGMELELIPLKQTVSVFLERVRSTAVSNRTAWDADIALRTRKSVAGIELREILSSLSSMAVLTPWTSTDRSKQVSVCLSFYFELAAWFGTHFLTDREIANARLLVATTAPRYAWEHRVASIGFPKSTTDTLRLSDAIQRFSEFPTPEDLRELQLLVMDWDVGSWLSSTALILDQLVHGLCPNLYFVLYQVSNWPSGSSDVIKLGVTLIEFCHDHSMPTVSLPAQRSLARIQYGAPTALSILAMEDASEFYHGMLPWGAPFPTDSDPSERLSAIMVLVQEFFTEHMRLMPVLNGFMRFPLRNEVRLGFEGTLTAAGRALGIAIRCGADLSFLNLALPIVALLHPRSRFDTPSQRFAEIVFELGLAVESPFEVVESAYLVSTGIAASLGAGGFELYNDVEWKMALGHSPEEEPQP